MSLQTPPPPLPSRPGGKPRTGVSTFGATSQFSATGSVNNPQSTIYNNSNSANNNLGTMSYNPSFPNNNSSTINNSPLNNNSTLNPNPTIVQPLLPPKVYQVGLPSPKPMQFSPNAQFSPNPTTLTPAFSPNPLSASVYGGSSSMASSTLPAPILPKRPYGPSVTSSFMAGTTPKPTLPEKPVLQQKSETQILSASVPTSSNTDSQPNPTESSVQISITTPQIPKKPPTIARLAPSSINTSTFSSPASTPILTTGSGTFSATSSSTFGSTPSSIFNQKPLIATPQIPARPTLTFKTGVPPTISINKLYRTANSPPPTSFGANPESSTRSFVDLGQQQNQEENQEDITTSSSTSKEEIKDSTFSAQDDTTTETSTQNENSKDSWVVLEEDLSSTTTSLTSSNVSKTEKLLGDSNPKSSPEKLMGDSNPKIQISPGQQQKTDPAATTIGLYAPLGNNTLNALTGVGKSIDEMISERQNKRRTLATGLPPPPPQKGQTVVTKHVPERSSSLANPDEFITRQPVTTMARPSLSQSINQNLRESKTMSAQKSQGQERIKFLPYRIKKTRLDELLKEKKSDDSQNQQNEKKKEKGDPVEMQKKKEEWTEKFKNMSEDQKEKLKYFASLVRTRDVQKGMKKKLFNQDQRERNARELLSTEETYVEQMIVLRDVYYKSLLRLCSGPNPPTSEETIKTIFLGVSDIVGFNEVFLIELRKKITNYKRKDSLSQCFLTLLPFFKMYKTYCKNYDNASQLLRKMEDIPKIKEKIMECDEKPETKRLGLASFLITPVQRIPRYRLLVQDLIKNTNPEHPDYDNLNRALSQIKEVADTINSFMKQIDGASEVRKYQEKFPNAKIFAPHRQFIAEFYLKNFEEKEGAQLQSVDFKSIVVFNDIILLLKGKNEFFGIFQLSELALLEIRVKKTFEDLKNAKNKRATTALIQKHQAQQLFFKIHCPSDDFIFQTKSIEEKTDILEKIFVAQYKLKKTNQTKKNDSVSDVHGNVFDPLATIINKKLEISEIDPEVCIEVMKNGSAMLKYTTKTKPHFRKFVLSPDESCVMWGSPKKQKKESTVLVCDITTIMDGQKTLAFMRYPDPDLNDCSFSIVYGSKTLDIIAIDNKQFQIWYFGLKYLISAQKDASIRRNRKKVSSESILRFAEREKEILDTQFDQKVLYEAFWKIGDAYSWGDGASFGLGHGNSRDVPDPTVISDFLFLDISKICAGENAGAVISKEGDIFSWGKNNAGKLGHGNEIDYSKPALIDALYKYGIEQVCMGLSHTLFLTHQGEVLGCGSNEKGQLGVPKSESEEIPPGSEGEKKDDETLRPIEPEPQPDVDPDSDSEDYYKDPQEDESKKKQTSKKNCFFKPKLLNSYIFGSTTAPAKIKKIACGAEHSLAISESGALYTFGAGEDGQLGIGSSNQMSTFVPTLIDKFPCKVVSAAGGLWHTLVLLEDGSVWSFGTNTNGQLGLGYLGTPVGMPAGPISEPQKISFLESQGIKVKSIACGNLHSACITEKLELYMWGSNNYGQCGIGSKEDVCVPTLVTKPPLLNMACLEISCGKSHNLAIFQSRKDSTKISVCAWGYADSGRLGIKSEGDLSVPTEIPILKTKTVRSVSAGSSFSLCICGHQWVPDSEAFFCMNKKCNSEFTFFNRKHHCRFCGGVFCEKCTSKRIRLLRFGFSEKQRVCDNCYMILTTQQIR